MKAMAPEDPKTKPEEPAEPVEREHDEEIGDFINRHILEKDTVFFEG
jgi:hypothetical protein